MIYRFAADMRHDVAGIQRAVWIASQYQRFAASADGDEKKAEMEARWPGLDIAGIPSERNPSPREPKPQIERATQGKYVIHGDFSKSLARGDFVLFQTPKKDKKSSSVGASIAPASMGASMSAPSNTVPGEIGRTQLVDGKFTIEGEVDEVRPVYFYVLNARTWDDRKMGATKGQGFILEPAELSLTMDGNHKPTISGGYFNDRVYGPWLHSTAYQDLQALIPLVFRALPGETEAEESARVEMGMAIQRALMDAETDGRKEVALLSPDLLVRQLSIETAWLGGGWMLDGARVIHRLDPDNEWAKKFVENGEANLEKRARNALAGQIDGRYLPFSATSIDGEPVSLSMTCAANKYVLLDSWASWCGPCRDEIPHLKKAYERYHEMGFEIFAYTLDDEQSAWTKASEDEGIPWIDAGLGRKSDPVLLYEIGGVPANYLIDVETGKVVARNLRGNALELKLNELLGEPDEER